MFYETCNLFYKTHVLILKTPNLKIKVCILFLNSSILTHKTNRIFPRKGKCTSRILPNAFATKNTGRAFPFPLFAIPKKRINFPHLSCIFTNKPRKSTAYNMVLPKDGVNIVFENAVSNIHKKLFR